jgi:hypothetical protein
VHSILFSADGHSWQPAADGGQDNQANQSVIAPFVGPGYYAVATPALGKHHGGLRSYLLIGVFIAAGVITVALVAFTYRSRRARLVRRRS